MDEKAVEIVRKYIFDNYSFNYQASKIEIFIVWKCKVLQNWKYLISSNINDGMYYELTYNGDKEEWYLDAYRKIENRVIKRMRD